MPRTATRINVRTMNYRCKRGASSGKQRIALHIAHCLQLEVSTVGASRVHFMSLRYQPRRRTRISPSFPAWRIKHVPPVKSLVFKVQRENAKRRRMRYRYSENRMSSRAVVCAITCSKFKWKTTCGKVEANITRTWHYDYDVTAA